MTVQKIFAYEIDGVVSIVTIAPGQTLEEVRKRAIPKGVRAHVLDADDLPSRTLRDAWRIVDGKVVVDADASIEIQASNARRRRDALLRESDWRALPDYPSREAWVVYRAALRALPEQEGFPENIAWPSAPTE